MNERNEDGLDRLLREDARRALDGAAFAVRVLSALPPSRARHAWLKPALIVGSTALGSLLAAFFAPVGMMFVDGVFQIAYGTGLTPAVSTTIGMTLVLAVAGYVLATED